MMRLMLIVTSCVLLVAFGCDTSRRDGATTCDGSGVDTKKPDAAPAPATPPANPGYDNQPPVAEAPVPVPDPAPQPVPVGTTPEAAVPANQETVVGKLQGGIVAIGAETTGWTIVPHNEQGNLAAVEVDIGAVRASAEKLEGSEVRAWGVYTIKTGIERGKMRVFVVRKIERIN